MRLPGRSSVCQSSAREGLAAQSVRDLVTKPRVPALGKIPSGFQAVCTPDRGKEAVVNMEGSH